MAKAILTQARLKELLHYDPVTGIFTWIAARRRVTRGMTAGCVKDTGYVAIRIDFVKYPAHRLAWLYMTGGWPAHSIDHRDTVRSNNAWNNLREATRAENAQNIIRAPRNSASGMLGARKIKGAGQWLSAISIGGKVSYLGVFKTPEEAHAAYVAAKRILHPFGNL